MEVGNSGMFRPEMLQPMGLPAGECFGLLALASAGVQRRAAGICAQRQQHMNLHLSAHCATHATVAQSTAMQ